MPRPDEDPGLASYFAAVHHFPPLTTAEEQALARRWIEHKDTDAANRLVCANLRFVVKIALGYRGYGLRLADLIEEGNVGLLEAVRRFDPDRNLRFMTYGSYWVRAYILAHVLRQSSMVGVGTGPLQSKLFFRMARERARLLGALGADASPAEIEAHLAKRFATTPERIRDMSGRLDGHDVSLDQETFRDGHVTHLERLADDHSSDVEAELARRERDRVVKVRLDELLKTMPARDREIVRRRLLTDEAETLAEIGRDLGLSRERVRQLELRLKGKLRRALSDLRPLAATAW
jgi:RNA polymerase sigma-32 factor